MIPLSATFSNVQLSLIPGLVGAPPPRVRRLVGAALPGALPLVVAPRLRAPSFLVATVPPALLLVGASLPFMQMHVRASLPCAPLLSVAPLLCAPSFAVTVPPPALLLPRLRCRLRLSLRVPPCP